MIDALLTRTLLAMALCLAGAACSEGTSHGLEGEALASRGAALPDRLVNRIGTPVTGSGALAQSLAEGEDEEEDKDYWAHIDFDRSNFE